MPYKRQDPTATTKKISLFGVSGFVFSRRAGRTVTYLRLTWREFSSAPNQAERLWQEPKNKGLMKTLAST